MKVAIIDFETTGVDPLTCIPLEVCAYKIELKSEDSWDGMAGYLQFFIRHVAFESVPDHITELTGITTGQILHSGVGGFVVFKKILEFTADCSYFIAHNRTFDMAVFGNQQEALALKSDFPGHNIFDTDNWFCSIEDAEYPARIKCRVLSHLALEYAFDFKDVKVHSAITDTHMVWYILWKSGNTLAKMKARRAEPWVYLQALIPPPWEDGGAGKEQAKKAGYSFETARGTTEPKFPKAWVKRVKQSQLDTEKKMESPFKRQVIRQA